MSILRLGLPPCDGDWGPADVCRSALRYAGLDGPATRKSLAPPSVVCDRAPTGCHWVTVAASTHPELSPPVAEHIIPNCDTASHSLDLRLCRVPAHRLDRDPHDFDHINSMLTTNTLTHLVPFRKRKS
jgi:hypothetical protein